MCIDKIINLVYKSKMLLPRAASGPEDVAEDPRRELVERLLEHERFKNAAQMLQQKQMIEAATWTNPGFKEFKDDAAAEPEIAADTVDLVRIFRESSIAPATALSSTSKKIP